MNTIFQLLNAEKYYEKNLRKVMVDHWNLWFPDYELTNIAIGSQKFQPDLIAVNVQGTEVILVE